MPYHQMQGLPIIVERLPKCDFCGRVARYRGRTSVATDGKVANMCEACFAIHGVTLAEGIFSGQELVLGNEKTISIDYKQAWIKLLDKINTLPGDGKGRFSRKELKEIMLECLVNPNQSQM